jgi:hypothetical protein
MIEDVIGFEPGTAWSRLLTTTPKGTVVYYAEFSLNFFYKK